MMTFATPEQLLLLIDRLFLTGLLLLMLAGILAIARSGFFKLFLTGFHKLKGLLFRKPRVLDSDLYGTNETSTLAKRMLVLSLSVGAVLLLASIGLTVYYYTVVPAA